MGWSFGWDSRKQLINHLTQAEYNPLTIDGQPGQVRWTCLKRCFKGTAFKGTLWAVFEKIYYLKSPQEPVKTERFIACFLLQYYRRDGWGYKDMTESMGPNYYNCPLSYLNLAPEANHEWREKVRAYHIKLYVGQRVKLHDGCQPNEVVITSVRPLRGQADGVTWNFRRGQIDKVLP